MSQIVFARTESVQPMMHYDVFVLVIAVQLQKCDNNKGMEGWMIDG